MLFLLKVTQKQAEVEVWGSYFTDKLFLVVNNDKRDKRGNTSYISAKRSKTRFKFLCISLLFLNTTQPLQLSYMIYFFLFFNKTNSSYEKPRN